MEISARERAKDSLKTVANMKERQTQNLERKKRHLPTVTDYRKTFTKSDVLSRVAAFKVKLPFN